MVFQIKYKMHSNKRYQNFTARVWFTLQDFFVNHKKPLMGCRILDAISSCAAPYWGSFDDNTDCLVTDRFTLHINLLFSLSIWTESLLQSNSQTYQLGTAGKILGKKIKEKRQISDLMISLSQDYISLISGSLLDEEEVRAYIAPQYVSLTNYFNTLAILTFENSTNWFRKSATTF